MRSAKQFFGRQKQLFLGEALGKVVKLEAHHQAADCTRLRSSTRHGRQESPLTSELKQFIDSAIVPILVNEYLAVTANENELANPARVSQTAPQLHGRTLARNVRP